MKQVFRKIPVYTGDVSGVCSALFELGGMVVMHDPSGCNSTYNTHDEIRWYDHDSLIFITGLNEMEAIMGSDEALIRDITEAARIYWPSFIAIANSPIPYITGMDLEAVSRLIEQETNIPAFYIPTNGMHDYVRGAGLAFLHLAQKFVTAPKSDRSRDLQTGLLRCNIIGMTPLDFASPESLHSLRKKISKAGMEIISCWAMEDSLDHICQSGEADVNLVVSSAGLPAAEYMQNAFGIPFVAGFPAHGTEELYFAAVRESVKTGSSRFPFRDRTCTQSKENCRDGSPCAVNEPGDTQADRDCVCLIGESVIMTSLAASIERRTGVKTHVFGAAENGEIFLGTEDAALSGEEELSKALLKLMPSRVVADPCYGDLLPEGTELIRLPHLAFSGRIFLQEIPDLMNFAP